MESLLQCRSQASPERLIREVSGASGLCHIHCQVMRRPAVLEAQVED